MTRLRKSCYFFQPFLCQLFFLDTRYQCLSFACCGQRRSRCQYDPGCVKRVLMFQVCSCITACWRPSSGSAWSLSRSTTPLGTGSSRPAALRQGSETNQKREPLVTGHLGSLLN